MDSDFAPQTTDTEAEAFRRDRGVEQQELGPKSRALLRRLVLAIETMMDMQFPDPGPKFEEEAQRIDAPFV